MVPPIQQDIIEKIARICELSPDVRFGQLLANLGFLAEDMTDHTLWDIDDDELLRVVESHEADLLTREQKLAT